jgi:hypothetical protein
MARMKYKKVMLEMLILQYKADHEGIESFTTNDICSGGRIKLPDGVTMKDIIKHYNKNKHKY